MRISVKYPFVVAMLPVPKQYCPNFMFGSCGGKAVKFFVHVINLKDISYRINISGNCVVGS